MYAGSINIGDGGDWLIGTDRDVISGRCKCYSQDRRLIRCDAVDRERRGSAREGEIAGANVTGLKISRVDGAGDG